MLGQQIRIPRGIQHDHVATDLALQFLRRPQRDEVAFVHDSQPVAALGLFHQVRGDQNGNMLFIAQNLQILPQIAPRARIQSCGRFIQ